MNVKKLKLLYQIHQSMKLNFIQFIQNAQNAKGKIRVFIDGNY